MLGRTVGHYTILEKLGEGGMGVVYKAHDTHLDRFVAIKVLPPERVADPERKRRFVQEAKAASALNHPNIVVVHDITSDAGCDFIVMEYIAGKTLEQLIARKGLGLPQTLKCAVQIADALAKAHAKGIVHRDLKPTNIMVTEDGLVKVLDFGLAKLTEPRGPEDATVTARTAEGVIVGTVAYMSPEQAEGKPVDARSDVFSFGSVLYEMITGRPAFHGETKMSTLAAILRQEPKPVREVLEAAPREVERIITHCLRKDPNRRFQHMDDLKTLLEELKEESDSGRLISGPPSAKKAARRWVLVAASAFAALLVAGVLGLIWWSGKPKPLARQPIFTQLTDQPGQELYPNLSPDGKSLLYASSATGNWDVYLQRVGGKNPINLTKSSPADDTQPAFSPDGEQIAFRSERGAPSGPGGIFVMGATGESVRRLTDFGYEPAWSPDGKQIVFATAGIADPADRPTGSQLWSVDVDSGQKRPVTTKEVVQDAVQPDWSPHGYRIAYWGQRGGQRDIWTVSADGKQPALVTQDAYTDWSPAWSPDGAYLYFSSDRGGSMNLWRVPIDEKSGKVQGPLEAIMTPSPYSGLLSISRDGRRVAYVQRVSTRNLQKIGFDPGAEKPSGQPVWITQGSKQVVWKDLSQDSEWLTFSMYGKQEDIFVIKTDGTELRQLTDDIHRDRAPRWSPDGKRIAFYSNRSGKYEIWTINPDGSGLRQLTYASSESVLYPVWSPDGTRLACTGGTPFIMEVAKSWKDQSPQPLPPLSEPNMSFEVWSWSPDGQKLAGQVRRAGGVSSGVTVYSLASRKLERLADIGVYPVWLKDNRRLLFTHQGKLYLVDSQSKKPREILSVAPHSISQPALSRDNRQVYFTLSTTEADIWLMTLE